MSTKPASVNRWANVGGAITVPPSGKQDVGWVAGEAPPAEYFNWLHNLSFQWNQWLSDGDVSFATLAMSGITTLTGLLNANGGIAVPTGKTVTLAGTTTLSVGTGLVSLGGALTATGLITGNGGVTVSTGQALTVAGTGTVTVGTGLVSLGGALTVTGLITATAGVTAAANAHVTVSGTGKFKHGVVTDTFSPMAAVALQNCTLTSIGNGGIVFTINGASPIVALPLQGLRSGVRASSMTVRGAITAGSPPITCAFASNGGVSVSAGNLSSSSMTTVVMAFTATTVNTGDSYYINFAIAGATAGHTISLQFVTLDYDQP